MITKNKNMVLVVSVLVVLVSIFFIGTVKAYDESSFADAQCIDTYDWINTAKTDYSLNQETGKFEVSGVTTKEYQNSSANELKLVFYEASADGKKLYAYVPSYAAGMASDITKKLISDAGIATTENCEKVLKVSKTITGEGQSSDDSQTNTNPGTDSSLDQNEVEKLESPNAASATSIVAIVVGVCMVLVAGYILLKKNNRLPFGKN